MRCRSRIWDVGISNSAQRSFAIASAMFMNSNSLPIALMQSLVITVPGLKWGDDDNNDAMVGRALTYLVLYSTMGMVVCSDRFLLAPFPSHHRIGSLELRRSTAIASRP